MTEGRWRHKNSGDVDIWVSKILEETSEFYKLNVYYILKSNDRSLSNKPDEIQIDKKDIGNWSRV